MEWLKELCRRVWVLIRRERFEQELEEEMRAHLEMQAEEDCERGMLPEQARYAARRQFGNVMRLREASRAAWGWETVAAWTREVRYSLRLLRRAPGFTAVSVVTLGLGIGVNCLIFSVVDTVLLRPFEFREPGRLVFAWTEQRLNYRVMSSLADFLDWRERNTVFTDMGAWLHASFDLSGSRYSERVMGARATASLFSTLGIQAQLGRTFVPEEEHSGHDRVVLLSEQMWRARFNADPGVIGSTILLGMNAKEPEPYTVVGILPAAMQTAFPRADIWAVLAIDGEEAHQRRMRGCWVLARLKPAETISQAEASMRQLAAALAQQYPETNRDVPGVKLRGFHEALTEYGRPVLWRLLGAVGFVLLLACMNLANLMLARGTERAREMSVRAAIGAGRAQLFRQLLLESLVLSLLGGAVGVLFAYWGLGATKALIPAGMLRASEVAINGRILLFSMAISIVTGLLFGTAPALRVSRVDLNPVLEGSRGTGARKSNVFRSWLVVSQIALGLVLLTGAGLMLNSFVRLLRVDPGFEQRRVLALETHLPRPQYKSDSARLAAIQEVLRRVAALPGVQHAGVTDFRPLLNTMNIAFQKEGSPSAHLEATSETIGGDYFAAMGTPLLRGRLFTARDALGAPAVAVVNETAARRYWRDEEPIGKRIVLRIGGREMVHEIVGIVGDVRRKALDRPADPAVYLAQTQHPSFIVEVVVRMQPGVSAVALASMIQTAMASVDKLLAAEEITTMDALVSKRLAQPRFFTVLLAVFGLLALVLTATGIYGVTAYVVRRRTREIGVRMALGASRASILVSVLARAAMLAGLGIALGVCGSLAAGRVLASVLYEIKPADPATLAASVLVMAAATLAAAFIPARRASKVDPMEALRYE